MTKEELMGVLDKQKMYEVDERGRLIEYSKDSTNPSRIYIDLFNLIMDLGDIGVDACHHYLADVNKCAWMPFPEPYKEEKDE